MASASLWRKTAAGAYLMADVSGEWIVRKAWPFRSGWELLAPDLKTYFTKTKTQAQDIAEGLAGLED